MINSLDGGRGQAPALRQAKTPLWRRPWIWAFGGVVLLGGAFVYWKAGT